MNYNTEIGKFCAVNKNWRELLSAEPFYLKIKEDDKYVMFCYDQINSDFNNSLVREARGIIFCVDKWENPVCWAFNKFGNYGESYVPEINWSTAFVTEKIDGSLIKVWWDEVWKVSTNGTIDAFKAELGGVGMPNFGEYFIHALAQYYDKVETTFDSFHEFTAALDPDLTYMFELVGPYNRVVVPYEEPALYFLGARNKISGQEYNCATEVLGLSNIPRPKQWPLTSIDECIRITETFTWDKEGFVVVDARGNRVKIKSPAYVLAHFARNNNVITRKHLIRVILQNEAEEFLCYASEYTEELQYTQKLMNAYYRIGNTLAAACRKASILPRPEYAKIVKTFPTIFQSLLFKNYDKDCYAQEFTYGWNENRWDACLEEMEKLKDDYFN